MSAKTKAYTETQLVAYRYVLGDLDERVMRCERATKGAPSDPHAKAILEAVTVARDAVARRLSKMQAARDG